MQLKKKRIADGAERIKWSKKHGHHTYFVGSDVEMASDSDDGLNQKKGKDKNDGNGDFQAKKKCAACGSITHKRSSHKECPFYKGRAKKEVHSVSFSVESTPVASESGSEQLDNSTDCRMSDSDICTCGAEGRAHKRSCPLSLRNHRPGRTLFFASDSGGHTAQCSSESHTPTPAEVKKPESQGVKPKADVEIPSVKVGDYVCLHGGSMSARHLPCRIVGMVVGRYQLYCSKGVLKTSFSRSELTPLTTCSPIPLDGWRQAPKVSLHTVINDPVLCETCMCHITESFESILVSSESEEEKKSLEMWVTNSTYSLSNSDQKLVLSRRGWLNDNIISAAQMMLLQFFPNMAGLQPPVLQVLGFQVHSGEFVQIIHVTKSHWCVVSTVGCESGVVRVYDSLYKTLSEDTEYLIATMVQVPSSDLSIVMMDVEKQSNGSDCGVLAIACVFDICSGMNPCTVRFDHSKIRQHLATCLENCQVSRFPILGDRVSVQKKPKIVELHCSC